MTDNIISRCDDIQLACWYTGAATGPIGLSRFRLPAEHAAKVRRERLSRDGDDNVVWTYVKGGLPEIVCFCLPETAFVRENEPVGDTYDKTIAVYFLDHVEVSDGLKRRLRQAINSWLVLQYQEDLSRDDIKRVSQSVMDDENWEKNMQVHPEMDASGECVNVNSQYYNALIARAASGLAGRPVRFQDGLTKYLVRKTPAGNIYNGIELVLFRPLGLLSGDDQYYFSEVVTLTTATFPGRQDQGVYVAARIRMRNWGPVQKKDSGKKRSFDVFMPAIQHEANNYGHFQHSTLMGRPGKSGVQWARKNDVRLYDLLFSLSDNDEYQDVDLTLPCANGHGQGSWWLPRLSSGHGDSFLKGGTGVPTPDRRDIIQVLDDVLAGELGLIKEQPLRRLPVKPVNPRPWGPFENKADQVTCMDRRAHISKALDQNGADDLLNILVLAMNEDTVEHIKGSLEKDFYHGCDFEERAHEINGGAHVRELLARPAGGAGGVRLISTMASPFSELMEPIQVEGTGVPDKVAMRNTTTGRLSHYLRQLREKLSIQEKEIGVAIFEMPGNFRDDSIHDPFWAAKQALSENRFLPQGLLREENMQGKGKAATHQEKCKAAFLDCLRMLGVSPLYVRSNGQAISDFPMPAAICNLSINNSKVLPVAIRLNVETGEIECCMRERDGVRGWEPYAFTVLRLYNHDFKPLTKGDAASKRAVRLFLTEVIEQLIRDNENLPNGGVIFVDPVNFHDDDIKGFLNKDMQLDRITVGAKTFTPREFGNTALVRIKPDGGKTPSYLIMPDKKGNTSSWASGLFRWVDGGDRTVFSLKTKSNTETSAARYNNDSRNNHTTFEVERRERKRSTAGLCEMTLALSPEDCVDDALARERIFFYCKRLCKLHYQYRYYTQLPFPLHELKLLGDCIQS